MHHRLEARLIPRGVAVRRAADMAELNFGGAFAHDEVEWKARLDQRVVLAPVDEAVEVEPVGACLQRHHLDEP